MSASDPTGFFVQTRPDGTLLLRGELDLATVQDLHDKIDEIRIAGQPIILDLAQLSFMDSSAIHCFVRAAAESGRPVVLRNSSPVVRRILDIGTTDPIAWVIDGEGPSGPAG
jgi:anti-anti-sigma factor